MQNKVEGSKRYKQVYDEEARALHSQIDITTTVAARHTGELFYLKTNRWFEISNLTNDSSIKVKWP